MLWYIVWKDELDMPWGDVEAKNYITNLTDKEPIKQWHTKWA